MTLVTEYAAIQKAKRLTVSVAKLRDDTKRNQALHHHPVSDHRPEGHDCPGCLLADRLSQALMEATR